MDPLTHVVVTALLVERSPATLLASVGPDLPWYVLYPAWLLSKRGVKAALQSGDWPLPPQWMQELHYAAHSVLVSALGLAAARLLCPRRARGALMWAWLLHIALDVPTHARRRMGTRIFWPFSTWALDGISWADGYARLVAAALRGGRATGG